MTETDPLTAEALDAEDYLLDCMGDAITLWDILRHPQSADGFARFDAVREADPWAARESVAQLVEFFQHATAALDAPADELAELFLRHCTNAAEESAASDDDPFIECVISFDLLPEAGEYLAALQTADATQRAELAAKLQSLRDRRDA